MIERAPRLPPPADVSADAIAAAVTEIEPRFLHTPQFASPELSAVLGREVVVKNETVTPIGSFKGRGTWLLGRSLDPTKTWVCSTAGNFGQGLAYAGRARGARIDVFVSTEVPSGKVAAMRGFGAQVHFAADPGPAAREHAAAAAERVLVIDGLHPETVVGAGTIAVELDAAGPIDLAIVQMGDGALASGIACWLKARRPQTRIIGVCAAGAPALARSFAAGRVVRTDGTKTIATALAISDPIPESLARVIALVDDIVLVDDDDLRAAQHLIQEIVDVPVEPAGAAGVAALTCHGAHLGPGRAVVLLTGAGAT